MFTVNAKYFKGTSGGFNDVNTNRGDKIDFYNIRYFDQGDSTYSDAASLFTTATGSSTLTSVN